MREEHLVRLLSRRDLLKGSAGLLAASALLNGCAAPAPTGTTSTASQAPSSQSVEDIYVMVLAAFADMSFRDATQMINDTLGEENYRYVLEEMAEGWETMVLSMVPSPYWLCVTRSPAEYPRMMSPFEKRQVRRAAALGAARPSCTR